MNEERLNELEQLKPLTFSQGELYRPLDEADAQALFAAARRCNELARHKDKSDRVAGQLLQDTYKLEKEALILRANNAALREACKAIVALDPDEFIPKWRSIADEALSATPADSLREYRNGVLQSVTKTLQTRIDEILRDEGSYDSTTDVTELPEGAETQIEELEWAIIAIRAMKEADNDSD